MQRNRFLLILISIVCALPAFAKEGMWLPYLLKQLNEADMQEMGLQLSAEDIYSVNQSSLKDAVLIFGGGCTGEMISDQGLVLTNHHCGYGRIQYHSSVEHDYLTDGFWAMDRSEELPNPGLTVTFIVSMEDVTEEVLTGITDQTSEAERDSLIRMRSKELIEQRTEGTHYTGEVKAFYHGNQYILIRKETFKDVRLVGAPPSSIGKFGFDTDNWVWPRHTGDFSLFRVYANADNKPADYSPDNVPYKPRHHFPISLNGYKADDFTMVFGFPGSTQEYLPAVAVEYVLHKSNPAKIRMRDTSLEIVGKAMASSPKINIQYAAKQSGIANAWKKWIGQSRGLERMGAIEKKRALEQEFTDRVESNPDWKKRYGTILAEYDRLYTEIEPYRFARELLIEYYYYGPEVFGFANRFNALTEPAKNEEERAKTIEKLIKRTESHFKDYNMPTDRALVKAMTPMYLEYLQPGLVPSSLKTWSEDLAAVDKVFEKSLFTDEQRMLDFLNGFKSNKVKAIEKDPAFRLARDILQTYRQQVEPRYLELQRELGELDRVYMEALMEVLPKYKKYYPDANFSLRLTYGKVDGYYPADAVEYSYYTTADGIMQKMDTTTKEFDVPEKLAELIRNRDYGSYADKNGDLRVCFIASNHTSGGNSGSPALNGKGELIGLNFDRTWESTMSDIMYDPSICRNIIVDVRYVLFIMDQYAGAGHLVEELTLIRD